MSPDEPPRFMKPGDNPCLDALLEQLRGDGEGGDPLYVDYRRQPQAADVTSPAAQIPPLGQTPPAPREPPAAQIRPASQTGPASQTPPAQAPRRRANGRGAWLALGTLGTVAPLIALGLGVLLRAPAEPPPRARAAGFDEGALPARAATSAADGRANLDGTPPAPSIAPEPAGPSSGATPPKEAAPRARGAPTRTPLPASAPPRKPPARGRGAPPPVIIE